MPLIYQSVAINLINPICRNVFIAGTLSCPLTGIDHRTYVKKDHYDVFLYSIIDSLNNNFLTEYTLYICVIQMWLGEHTSVRIQQGNTIMCALFWCYICLVTR